MLLAIDTETTGVDPFHGSRPFYVMTCDGEGVTKSWQWAVDPLTRMPDAPASDLSEIYRLIRSADTLVLHNAKFDVHAIRTLLPRLDWPWERTEDTMMMAHLTQSNQMKNLTDLAMNWLVDENGYGLDIQPLEKSLEHAVKECRKRVQLARNRFEKTGRPERYHDWRISEDDDPMSPSGGGWRGDYWLPAAMAEAEGLPADHPWRTVLADYADTDSPTTMALWRRMGAEIERRGLGRIYRERLRLLPIAYRMERRGVTLDAGRLEELKTEYAEDVETGVAKLETIAEEYGHELKVPNGASPNNSLREFFFDHLKLPPIYSKKSKTDTPTLNKDAMFQYAAIVDKKTLAGRFLETWEQVKKRRTYNGYMNAYQRYWVEQGNKVMVVHGSFNPTDTDTLRWSANDPNLQNISKKGLFEGDTRTLRYCFGPAPGREWWSLDAKNIELRIPAYKSGEQALIDLFERADEPPFYGSQHILNFSVVYPDIWEKAVKDVGLAKAGPWCKKNLASTWYQWVKNGDFAIQYNCGRATADQAFHRKGAYDALKSQFSDLERLNQQCIAHANRHGFVEVFPDRSVDPDHGYPLAISFGDRGAASTTTPLSYVVQGTAMQWTNRAMVRVSEFYDALNSGERFAGRRWPGGYYIAIQQHDELVPDCPSGAGRGESPHDYNLPVIRETMRLMSMGGDDIGVPTPVGCEYHPEHWAVGVSV